MTKIIALFQMLIFIFMSFFGIVPVSSDLNVKTMSVDSWGGNKVMFCSSEIPFDADCEIVEGGKAPAFRFENSAEIIFNAKSKYFNYFGLVYSSTKNLKCEMTYKVGSLLCTEEFFLEKSSEEKEFYSFTKDCERGKDIRSLKFTNLNTSTAKLSLFGFSVFNRESPKDEVFIQNESYKIGVYMFYGGVLEYMECLKGNVQAVKLKDKSVEIDRNAKLKYGGELLTSNVNLINRYDSGRFVQQSYYGTDGRRDDYVCGDYNGVKWPYNPVQGGNLNGDRSRIIDFKITDNSIYVKTQPMDWAKSADDISKAYMESTYTLTDNAVLCDFSITDFSGYAARKAEQEFPAIYIIEPLNCFAYYSGGGFVYENDLQFWGDYPDQYGYTDTGISGFFGSEDGFGVGVYSPGISKIKAGVFLRNKESNFGKDPSSCSPTSYIAPISEFKFKSFKKTSYRCVLAAGTADEVKAVLDGYAVR